MSNRAPLTTACHASIRNHANGDISLKLDKLKAKIVAQRLGAETLAEHARELEANGHVADTHKTLSERAAYLAKISASQEAFDKYHAAYVAKPVGKELKTLADATKEAEAYATKLAASKAKKAAHNALLLKHEGAKRVAWGSYKKDTSVIVQTARGGSDPVDAEHVDMVEFDKLRRQKDRVPKVSAGILGAYVKTAVADVVSALRDDVNKSQQSKIDIKHLLSPEVQNTQLMRIAKQFPTFGKVASWFENQSVKENPRVPFPIDAGDFLSVFKKLIPKKGKNSEEGSKVSQNLRLALAAMTEEVVAYICRDIIPSIMAFSGKKTIDAKTMRLALTTATALMGGVPQPLLDEWNAPSPAQAAEEAAAAAKAAAEAAAAAAALAAKTGPKKGGKKAPAKK